MTDYFIAIPESLHSLVAPFIGLDYLRLRVCSQAFRTLLTSDRIVSRILCEDELIIFLQTSAIARSDVELHLQKACRGGLLTVAQWLAAHFDLTATNARCDNNFPLRLAVAGGHLETARWLATYFGLTPADARAECNQAFRSACTGGHLSTAAWLVSRFGLGPSDLPAVSENPLVAAWMAGLRADR